MQEPCQMLFKTQQLVQVMLPKLLSFLFLVIFLVACDTQDASDEAPAIPVGKFQVDSDLYLAQFDSKTDVDDIHSIAGVATMLADDRLKGVNYHAVAGAYGTQGGLYIPSNELFDAAFGNDWSDAHNNFDRAVNEVTAKVTRTLERGGNVWIAEAGQSDFTAAVVRKVKEELPNIDTAQRIHVVQHSTWNEGSTSPANLNYVRQNTAYSKIPDGNAIGNGSPGLRINNAINWKAYIKNPRLVSIWEMAIQIANTYNGTPSRYKNQFIASGGMDFSDVSETCWIFGFQSIRDVEEFFETFSSN